MTTYEHESNPFEQSGRRWRTVAANIIDKLSKDEIISEHQTVRELSPVEKAISQQLDCVPGSMEKILGAQMADTPVSILSSRTFRSSPARYATSLNPSKMFQLHVEGVSTQDMWLTRTPLVTNRVGREVLDTHNDEVIARVHEGNFSYDWQQSYETTVVDLTIAQQQQRAQDTLTLLDFVAQAQPL